jgi:hypothetical protein
MAVELTLTEAPDQHHQLDDHGAMQRLLLDLDVGNISGMANDGSEDPDVAIHELISQDVILWGKVLEKFLRLYHKEFRPYGEPLSEEVLAKYFDVVFDERTLPLTRYIIKKTLKRQDVSLADLAAVRYSRGLPHFRNLQVILRERHFQPMEDLHLWNIKELTGQYRSGQKRLAGYSITAGPALWLFHKWVYMPWRSRHISWMHTQFLQED